MTYTSRYLVPLSLTLGAFLWACSSSSDIPETTGDGDGDMTGDGDAPATGGVSGDGDAPATGGAVVGDGDAPATGGAVVGDGDAPATGGAVIGDGDGDAPATGGISGDGDGDVAGTGGTVAMGDPPGTSCDLGTNYSLGEMRLLNNQWTSTQNDQCIFINADRSFGWRWDNSAGTGGFTPLSTSQPDYPNYPEVEFGINPWGREQDAWEVGSSSTGLLPIRLGDLTSASMTINVNSQTSGGSWNLAFELWLSPTDPTLGETTPSAELMVFFGNDPAYWPETTSEAGGGATNGDYTLYVSDDQWAAGYRYRQWRKNGSNGTNVSFNGTLDIKSFLDQSGFDANWYVTRFEIGNEVYTGSVGETTITSLAFEVNGESRSAL